MRLYWGDMSVLPHFWIRN